MIDSLGNNGTQTKDNAALPPHPLPQAAMAFAARLPPSAVVFYQHNSHRWRGESFARAQHTAHGERWWSYVGDSEVVSGFPIE